MLGGGPQRDGGCLQKIRGVPAGPAEDWKLSSQASLGALLVLAVSGVEPLWAAGLLRNWSIFHGFCRKNRSLVSVLIHLC